MSTVSIGLAKSVTAMAAARTPGRDSTVGGEGAGSASAERPVGSSAWGHAWTNGKTRRGRARRLVGVDWSGEIGGSDHTANATGPVRFSTVAREIGESKLLRLIIGAGAIATRRRSGEGAKASACAIRERSW